MDSLFFLVLLLLFFSFLILITHITTDVIQEVEYVKNDSKIVYLLECLQKTAPPVVIFSARTKEVDDIHEYLLIKGVRNFFFFFF